MNLKWADATLDTFGIDVTVTIDPAFADVARELDLRPLTPLVAMGSIARALPDDVAVVEEAVTTTNTTAQMKTGNSSQNEIRSTG